MTRGATAIFMLSEHDPILIAVDLTNTQTYVPVENQPQVIVSGTGCTYYSNGNLTSDPFRGIRNIEWNGTGMPLRVSFSSGEEIRYTYAATGGKLSEEFVDADGTTLRRRDIYGNIEFLDGAFDRRQVDGGYIDRNSAFHVYVNDYQGNVLAVLDCATGLPEQFSEYYPYGLPHPTQYAPETNRRRFGGKEYTPEFGFNVCDFGTRLHDTLLGSFLSPDPKAADYPHISPYAYCAADPVNLIDPTGEDWYKCNETDYYTWYDSKKDIKGYTHIGGKGSVLGEFETIIDNILSNPKERINIESIYSPGFTFAIANNGKTGLSGSSNTESSLFNDFITGKGPEFTIFLSDHPYTQALKLHKRGIESQLIIKLGLQDNRTNVKSGQFYPWDATLDSPMQFIGSFRYDGYTSDDGTMINNVVFDSKSMTSLFYHIPGIRNRRRKESKRLGTTYQLYIWQSKK